MTLVDTNIILRWLLNDNQLLSKSATKIIEAASLNSLLITDIIVSEIVYVLRGKGYSRQQIVNALSYLYQIDTFKYENEDLIIEVMNYFVTLKLDFADCYLLARSKREKLSLQTFDKKMQKALKTI